MQELKVNEMKNIKGGSASSWILAMFGIASAIAFISGVLDGFTRPVKRN